MQYNKGMLTAIAAMPYHNYTVMFVGTEHGQLLKVPLLTDKISLLSRTNNFL